MFITNCKRGLFAAAVLGLLIPFAVCGQPNIVLFMADDLSHYNVSAYGSTNYHTPNLDRMAVEGMRFTHCYSVPLCTPSRVEIMSGVNNGRNYIQGTIMDESIACFANVIKTAGYATCVTGKWKLTKAPLTDPLGHPNRMGFDEYCLTEATGAGASRYRNPKIGQNGVLTQYSDNSYGPDIVCNYALDFIERNTNQPFLLYYPMVLVHDPYEPTPDDPEDGQAIEDRRFYPSMVNYMDKNVGRVISKLDELGLRENTIVLFTGDNGTKQGFSMYLTDGSVYPGGKGMTSDTGMHVPLIVNQPGTVATNSFNNDLIDFTDFFPTLCDVAGAAIPANLKLDGTSFYPAMLGQPYTARTAIYDWYENNPGDGVQEYAFNQNYKLYRDGRFYNLQTDLFETTALNTSGLTGTALQTFTMLQGVLSANTDLAVTSIALSAPTNRMAIGASLQLVGTAYPLNARKNSLRWSSSNPAVATVNKWGEVAGMADGGATITATSFDNTRSNSYVLAVGTGELPPPPPSIDPDISFSAAKPAGSYMADNLKDAYTLNALTFRLAPDGADNRTLGQEFVVSSNQPLGAIVLRSGSAHTFPSNFPPVILSIVDATAGSVVLSNRFSLAGKSVATNDYVTFHCSEPVGLESGQIYRFALWPDGVQGTGDLTKWAFRRSYNNSTDYPGGAMLDSEDIPATAYPLTAPVRIVSNRDMAFGLLAYSAPLSGYDAWAAGFSLSGTHALDSANPDNDRFNNLYEYGLGGDPTNGNHSGYAPVFRVAQDGGSNWVEFIHVVRSGVSSELNYALKTAENLLSNHWSLATYAITGTNDLGTGFSEFTNVVPTDVETRFLRLDIRRKP